MKAADKTLISAKNGLPSYTLIRTDRKTLEIKVQPYTGEIVIRIPCRSTKTSADDFLRRNLSSVMQASARAQQMQPDSMHTPLSDSAIKALKAQADAYIPDRVRYWCGRLSLPMPDKISYTAAKQRFGSCRKYPDGRVHLCFSYRLMQYPADAIDAVVLHEVAHMRHLDHSDAFYALILTHMPDYHIRHVKLKT